MWRDAGLKRIKTVKQATLSPNTETRNPKNFNVGCACSWTCKLFIDLWNNEQETHKIEKNIYQYKPNGNAHLNRNMQTAGTHRKLILWSLHDFLTLLQHQTRRYCVSLGATKNGSMQCNPAKNIWMHSESKLSREHVQTVQFLQASFTVVHPLSPLFLREQQKKWSPDLYQLVPVQCFRGLPQYRSGQVRKNACGRMHQNITDYLCAYVTCACLLKLSDCFHFSQMCSCLWLRGLTALGTKTGTNILPPWCHACWAWQDNGTLHCETSLGHLGLLWYNLTVFA